MKRIVKRRRRQYKKIFTIIGMIIGLFLLHLVVPLEDLPFIKNLLVSCLYALIGATIFLSIAFKNGVLYDVLGKDYIDRILNKFKRVLKIK